MIKSKKMKVAVVSGGFSEEQDSSRKSGKGIAGALEALGHEACVIEYDDNLINNIKKCSPDVVFPIVQGKHHSDGTVQALLELTGIAYTGSRPQSAAVINHKTICKKIWRAAGILTPDFFEYNYDEYIKDGYQNFIDRAENYGLTPPVVAKPPTQGGKFGIIFVRDELSFKELESSFGYDSTLLVEEYIKGQFFTQGIVEIGGIMTAFPPVEVIDNSNAEFKLFSRENSDSAAHDLSPEQVSEISRITLEAASLTGASGFARLDYHLSLSDGKLYLLEINAAPGLAPEYSHINKCAEAAGYDYNAFIDMLLATAKKHKRSV
jgi:D-alanine-D-alanine ligase